jgi:hypothetical protein
VDHEPTGEDKPGEETRGGENRNPAAHGGPSPVPIDALIGDDPELWLVTAELHAWSNAHACECEALCECDA